ncbi:hypothetical protein ANN_10569 [Periplaneta americana]|uniref:Uncharacterized protein n=1 Tax=Periplaneta americana TaxID=6978 RepID=A0ABQ8TQZ7_PERAM|nr:hypothetical protein ANN_10569 [Periplaneta americana]
MAGLCEGGNKPPGSLKATREGPRPTSRLLASRPHAEAEVDDHSTRMEKNIFKYRNILKQSSRPEVMLKELKYPGDVGELMRMRVLRTLPYMPQSADYF